MPDDDLESLRQTLDNLIHRAAVLKADTLLALFKMAALEVGNLQDEIEEPPERRQRQGQMELNR